MPNGRDFQVAPSLEFMYEGDTYIVQDILDSDTVRLVRPDHSDPKVVRVIDLAPRILGPKAATIELSNISKAHWKIATRRYFAAIQNFKLLD